MLSAQTDDVRIESLKPLIAPAILMEEYPLLDESALLIAKTRLAIEQIIQGNDDRLLVVVGPCSIHDPNAALEYAAHLKKAMADFHEQLCIVMRVYFEKPRTTVGWKGLINDPALDNSFQINQGLRVARKLLVELSTMGVPAGTELLDTIVPQFICDAISWGAIGARTTESQIHRELASGLSMPIGFKNGTDGNIQIALDAIFSAQNPHHFLSVTKQGTSAIVTTKGNSSCHLILRGGKEPNYFKHYVENAFQSLKKMGMPRGIMIDCSHGNSQKDHLRQKEVIADVVEQVSSGVHAICGVMLESHLVAGKQLFKDKAELHYGQSITDACIGWDETYILLKQLAGAVKARRAHEN